MKKNKEVFKMNRLILLFLLIPATSFANGYTIYTLFNGHSVGTSFSSIGLDTNQSALQSLQFDWSASLGVGYAHIEVSNDNVSPGVSDPGANVVNWSQYGSSIAVNGISNSLVNIGLAAYRWLRVRYEFVSGSGTISVNYFGKQL